MGSLRRTAELQNYLAPAYLYNLLHPTDSAYPHNPTMSPSIDAPKAQSRHATMITTSDSNHPDHPFNKGWRGNKQGTVRLEGIPKFADPLEEREWIKVSGIG
jgi:hypothetical protein